MRLRMECASVHLAMRRTQERQISMWEIKEHAERAQRTDAEASL